MSKDRPGDRNTEGERSCKSKRPMVCLPTSGTICVQAIQHWHCFGFNTWWVVEKLGGSCMQSGAETTKYPQHCLKPD